MPPASHDKTDSPTFVNWDSSPLTKPAWVFAYNIADFFTKWFNANDFVALRDYIMNVP